MWQNGVRSRAPMCSRYRWWGTDAGAECHLDGLESVLIFNLFHLSLFGQFALQFLLLLVHFLADERPALAPDAGSDSAADCRALAAALICSPDWWTGPAATADKCSFAGIGRCCYSRRL